jgi:signal peptidase II
MIQPKIRQPVQKKKFVFPDYKAHLIFWPLAITGLALDLWSKWAAFNKLDEWDTFPVIDGFMQFVTALNDGAVWGSLSGKYHFLAAVSIIAMVVIFVIFFFSGRQPRIFHVALGFLAAGIAGNLYDRIFNDGLVRDFIDVYYHSFHWPTFNVADIWLCVGAGLLLISTFIIEMLDRKHARRRR